MEENQAAESLGDLLDHEYDGIREYDNPCPGWWLGIFFLTALFAPFYFFYFHVGKAGITIFKDHENAVAENMRLKFQEIGQLSPDESTMLEYMQKPKWLQVGRAVYETQCKTCHGEGGKGIVGPNLTDDYYKNVNKLTDIITVVTHGAGNGSMPSWDRLHPNEIVLVSAFVASLRGQNLSGRPQEGKEIPPWPTSSSQGDDPPASPGDADSGDGDAAPAKAADENPAGESTSS